jgi:hypothetical protein
MRLRVKVLLFSGLLVQNMIHAALGQETVLVLEAATLVYLQQREVADASAVDSESSNGTVSAQSTPRTTPRRPSPTKETSNIFPHDLDAGELSPKPFVESSAKVFAQRPHGSRSTPREGERRTSVVTDEYPSSPVSVFDYSVNGSPRRPSVRGFPSPASLNEVTWPVSEKLVLSEKNPNLPIEVLLGCAHTGNTPQERPHGSKSPKEVVERHGSKTPKERHGSAVPTEN